MSPLSCSRDPWSGIRRWNGDLVQAPVEGREGSGQVAHGSSRLAARDQLADSKAECRE